MLVLLRPPNQCVRLGKPCGYSLKQQQEPSEDTDVLLQKIQQLERRLELASASGTTNSLTTPQMPLHRRDFRTNLLISDGFQISALAPGHHSSFPIAFFLDPAAFTPLPHGLFDSGGRIPTPVLEILHSQDRARGTCEAYYSTVHKWLPMLSKKRLVQRLSDLPLEFDDGLALLLLCITLVIENPKQGDSPQTPLYQLAKQYHSFMEDSGRISLNLLQATILIAVYEIGHGIYPTGYLTVTRAGRLGMLMGLHDRKIATQLFREPHTWTIREEERRAWWAALLLDR